MNTNTEREELARITTGAFYKSGSSLHAMTAVLRLAWFRVADAILAAGYRKPRTITTVEELDALPVGSVVLAHWPDGSQPDYQMTRCPEGAASAGGGFGVAGGLPWRSMASWHAELTVLYTPEATR